MHRYRAVTMASLALALSVPVAGCGASTQKPSVETTASSADRVCRDQWTKLGSTLGDKATQGVLVARAFASRWDSIEAGIGYYQATARADQCGHLLTAQRKAVADLDTVVTEALAYDIVQRAGSVVRARTSSKKESKPVRTAYRTLQTKAVPAGRDLVPAFTELAAADPANHKAVRRGLKDLALLARNSNAYLACRHALATIRARHR